LILEAYRQYAETAQTAMIKKLNAYETRLHTFELAMLSRCRTMKRVSLDAKNKLAQSDVKTKSLEKKLTLADTTIESLKKYVSIYSALMNRYPG
jgi:hypothetical protein